MKTIVLALVGLVVIGGALAAFWFSRGPDVAQFARLKEPCFTHLPDARMLVVEAHGDPNVVGAKAFKRLFAAYYTLEGVSRGRPPAPRARWPKAWETAKEDWVGYYALPVPSGASLPAPVAGDADLPATIATWQYGDVAEILHAGSYSSEEPDIRRLIAFVTSNGYRTIGDHEEEYVRGPGMFFAGNPDTYLTIIRLRVEKSN